MGVKICAFFSVIGVAVGAFLGGMDGLVTALIAAVAIDYITGVVNAIHERKLSSEVGFKGIAKKVLIFLLVGFANILDVHVLGGVAALRGAVIFFYLANEGLSIVENFARLGVPFPERIKDVLLQLKDKK